MTAKNTYLVSVAINLTNYEKNRIKLMNTWDGYQL